MCSRADVLVRQAIGRFNSALKQLCPPKTDDRDRLQSSQIVLRLSNDPTEQSHNDCLWWHVGYLLKKPWEPTFHVMEFIEDAPPPRLPQVSAVVAATGQINTLLPAIRRLGLTKPWFMTIWCLSDSMAPVQDFLPKTVWVVRLKEDSQQFWPPRRAPAHHGGWRQHVEDLLDESSSDGSRASGESPRDAGVGDDLGFDGDGGDGGEEEPPEQPMLERLWDELMIGEEESAAEDEGIAEQLGDAVSFIGGNGCDGEDDDCADYDDDSSDCADYDDDDDAAQDAILAAPADGTENGGARASRSGREPAIVVETEGGSIHFYRSNFSFEAVCADPRHGRRCTRTRTSIPGRRPGQGRPLGYLVAWLADGREHDNREGHQTAKRFEYAMRALCRDVFSHAAGSELLLAEEREPEPGEGEEPEHFA